MLSGTRDTNSDEERKISNISDSERADERRLVMESMRRRREEQAKEGVWA
jgi:hypothetical protein